MDTEILLAQLRSGPAIELVDAAAEALATAAESVSALADHDSFDTATLWWAAGTLSEAGAALLPYTSRDLPNPLVEGGELPDDPEQPFPSAGKVIRAAAPNIYQTNWARSGRLARFLARYLPEFPDIPGPNGDWHLEAPPTPDGP